MCHSILKPRGQEEGWGPFLWMLVSLRNLHEKNGKSFNNPGLKWDQGKLTTSLFLVSTTSQLKQSLHVLYWSRTNQSLSCPEVSVFSSACLWSGNSWSPSLTEERKSPTCSREDASYLNKHIDRWRAGSPWELWSPLPPPLCGIGLMGVRGERPGQKEKTAPFIPALLPDHGTQQNKTALSCEPSTGSRSPGDRWEQTEVFVTSQLSASGFTLESRALVLWMGPLKQPNILMGEAIDSQPFAQLLNADLGKNWSEWWSPFRSL